MTAHLQPLATVPHCVTLALARGHLIVTHADGAHSAQLMVAEGAINAVIDLAPADLRVTAEALIEAAQRIETPAPATTGDPA